MLTSTEILKRMETGQIVIEPFNESQLNPNSYNIRLSNKLLVYDVAKLCGCAEYSEYIKEHGRRSYIDSKEPTPTIEIAIPEEGLILEPGVLYLGSTEEYTETYDLIPCIDGRSSIGRLGINIHATAGFGDVGFKGTWTLEISVIHPVKIYPGMEIGQIYYEEPTGEIGLRYDGKYQGQSDPKASNLYKELN